MSREGWLPDGKGLDPLSVEVVREHGATVHLRLTQGDGYPRTACDRGLGELWSGKASEVTCPGCLEVVHA